MVLDTDEAGGEIGRIEDAGDEAAFFFLRGEAFDQDEAGGGNQPLAGFVVFMDGHGLPAQASVAVVGGAEGRREHAAGFHAMRIDQGHAAGGEVIGEGTLEAEIDDGAGRNFEAEVRELAGEGIDEAADVGGVGLRGDVHDLIGIGGGYEAVSRDAGYCGSFQRTGRYHQGCVGTFATAEVEQDVFLKHGVTAEGFQARVEDMDTAETGFLQQLAAEFAEIGAVAETAGRDRSQLAAIGQLADCQPDEGGVEV